ncbi:hypothetical protein ESCO_000843 [Escovopsis weberi]|uniref:DNA replication regulator Sld3 C-terminal domain-containing protein n=1 Tax=Escovopsis weberi TaxID=150374 RepID=A0A0M8N3C4_ESCWE|nr:hypothetical protein ESCO_000843 [Escovopsis weberi]
MSPSAPRGAAGAASPARSPEGVLTPSKEGVLNRTTAHAPAASKTPSILAEVLRSSSRRLCIAHNKDSWQPHPPNLHVAPRTLHPLMLLPRQHLPLSCIDAVGSSNELGHSRFFEAQIRILELESRLGSVTNLLIARYEPRGSVYALERQANALYVMCKLGAWVDLDELAGHATAIAEEQFRPARPERPESTVSDAFITPQLHSEQKRKRAAIEEFQSLVKKRARAASSTTTTTTTTANDLARREGTVEPDGSAPQGQSPQVKLEDSFVLETDAKENIPPAGCALPKVAEQEAEALPQHTADDVFGNIRSHYIDALYKSMGSLAYFAKGPLSRARSAFHLDLDSNLDMSDLIDFLKGLVLTTVQIDTKYRQTVPDLISKMKAGFESSDDGRKKKRKSKKMKIGKDALYPAEDESIRKWWTASKAQLMENEAEISSSQIKSHISVLRTRETQLQMILIMEILALEPLRGSADQGEGILPGDTDAQDIGATSQAKKRNKHNLPLLLDVHADRLTIWQSTATDEQILLEDSQSARVSADGSQGKKASSEPLKDFCIDVIVPFFSARLPELCDSITRKLGGPAIIAPAQSKASKQHQAKDQKPGSVTKRSASASSGNPRRTLQRALSTDQQSRRSKERSTVSK